MVVYAVYFKGMMGAKRWLTEMPAAGKPINGSYNPMHAKFFTAEEVEAARAASAPIKLHALEHSYQKKGGDS